MWALLPYYLELVVLVGTALSNMRVVVVSGGCPTTALRAVKW